ncbi:MAG: hypothetical protein CME62_15085 [Halobacteriovoraceae bacterium]|nr:hypothetical protein [Halobacteriovoraceae bacterium]
MFNSLLVLTLNNSKRSDHKPLEFYTYNLRKLDKGESFPPPQTQKQSKLNSKTVRIKKTFKILHSISSMSSPLESVVIDLERDAVLNFNYA